MSDALRTRSPERGIALLAVVFLVLLLAGLSFGLIEEGMAARTSVRHHESNLQALEILEAGVARAVQEVRAQHDSGSDGIGVVSGAMRGGDYAVTAATDAVNPDRWILQARGSYALSVRRVEVCWRRRQNSYFVEGLFSDRALTATGDVYTDAYDSRLGTYASQAVNVDAHGPYAMLGGSVGSNEGITLNGSAGVVRGNAIPGPLQTTVLNGDKLVTGDRYPREFEMPLEPVPLAEFEQAFLNNDNGSLPSVGKDKVYDDRTMTMTLNGGQNFTLTSGTYFFESLSVAGNATLTISGPVKIYVTGDFDTTGGAVVHTGLPQDFQVFAHPYPLPKPVLHPSSSVKLTGGAALSAAIYSPGADVKLSGGTHFYGAAVGSTIDVGGGGYFHYDKALSAIGMLGVATMERLYWREISPPRR